MKKEQQTSVEVENMVVTPITPGAVLLKARMEANLSIEEVATRLCLRSTVIESIEADNYSGISRHVFSRGYLRAYARLMHLDADKIIQLFNDLNLKEEVQEGMLWQAPRAAVAQKENPIKWLIILVIACSCFLAAMWWNASGSKLSSSFTKNVSLFKPMNNKRMNTYVEHDSLGAYSQIKGKTS